MTSSTITLVPLGKHQRETFIRDLQAAFSVAVIEKYGKQEGEIIPREEVAQSLDQPGAEAFQLTPDRKAVGGAVVTADRAAGRCSPELLSAPILPQPGPGPGIRRPRCGRSSRRILKNEKSASTSTSAASKSWDSFIPTTGTRRYLRPTASAKAITSALKSSCPGGNFRNKPVIFRKIRCFKKMKAAVFVKNDG